MKPARRAISGVLLLDKPEGLSSNSAVGWSKRLFNAAKAGHTGTLDPFATGLLPICFGEAAKFARFHLDADKGYLATLKLGERSSTGDTEGDIVERRQVETDEAAIDRALERFRGPQTQVPPMYSAIKKDGVPLYQLARKGIELDREPRAITVHRLQRTDWRSPFLVLDTTVSKGTYVRTLAEDIGNALGCGAHLVALRRTSTADFPVENAIGFEALEAMTLAERDARLLPCDALAMALPSLQLAKDTAWALANGQQVSVPGEFPNGGLLRIYDEARRFLGVASATANGTGVNLVPERMMGGADVLGAKPVKA